MMAMESDKLTWELHSLAILDYVTKLEIPQGMQRENMQTIWKTLASNLAFFLQSNSATSMQSCDTWGGERH